MKIKDYFLGKKVNGKRRFGALNFFVCLLTFLLLAVIVNYILGIY
jgi:hypothetical protein